MTRFARALVGALSLFSALDVRADANPKLLDEALALANYRASMKAARATLEASIDERRSAVEAKIGKERYERARRALLATFTEEALFSAFRAEMSKHADDTALSDIIAWHKSTLGKVIDETGSARRMAQEKRQIEAYMSAIKAGKVLTEPRLKLGALISEKRETALTATTIELGVARSLAVAVNATYAPAERQDEASINQGFAAMRADLLNEQRNNVLLGLLVTYRDLPDEELKQYLAFLSKPGTSRFHRTAIEALRAAIDALARDAGARASS